MARQFVSMESLRIRFFGKCICNLGPRFSAARGIRVSGAKDERRTTQQPIRDQQWPTRHRKTREDHLAVHDRNCSPQLKEAGRQCLKTLIEENQTQKLDCQFQYVS